MYYLVYNLSTAQAPLLSPADLDAREQEAYAHRGERYLLIRSLLKHELQRLTGIPAPQLHFTYSDHGKPELPNRHFNISHSGDLLCMAFHHRPIGVDIERLRERPRLSTVAARIMCAEQYAAWQQRRCPLQEFYACWCAAESIIKLYGANIWQAHRYPFLYLPEQKKILPQFEGAPAVELFEPAEGYMGALATVC